MRTVARCRRNPTRANDDSLPFQVSASPRRRRAWAFRHPGFPRNQGRCGSTSHFGGPSPGAASAARKTAEVAAPLSRMSQKRRRNDAPALWRRGRLGSVWSGDWSAGDDIACFPEHVGRLRGDNLRIQRLQATSPVSCRPCQKVASAHVVTNTTRRQKGTTESTEFRVKISAFLP